MRPIAVQCSQLIPRPATAICEEIADTTRWREFKGYGPLPGIAHAEYEHRTATMVGSRIRVRSTDGSLHTEEIERWVPGSEVALRFHDFTPPLSGLATHFTEMWSFQPAPQGTLVTRVFHLYPRRPATRPALWLISRLLRRAVARQLREMAKPG
jgi:hypothetical protein